MHDAQFRKRGDHALLGMKVSLYSLQLPRASSTHASLDQDAITTMLHFRQGTVGLVVWLVYFAALQGAATHVGPLVLSVDTANTSVTRTPLCLQTPNTYIPKKKPACNTLQMVYINAC